MDPEATVAGSGAGPDQASAAPPTAPAPDGPEAPAPASGASEPGRRRVSWPQRIAISGAVLLVGVVLAGFVIRVPYTTIAPGEAVSLPPLVSVQGAPSYSADRGDIRLLFVREAYHVNLWQYVRAWLDRDIDIASDGAVNPASLTPLQQEEQGLQAMADAKTAATYVALRAAGYKVKLAPGLTVSDLTTGMPAIKALVWGDVLISADGRKIVTRNDLDAVITKHKVGDALALVVDRSAKLVHVKVALAVFTEGPAKGHKGLGVSLSPRFSFPVKVNVVTTGIGGPSAGLAMTLAIVDDLTPGNLTGGARVAVTGTIDADGNVGEIGGIQQKAVAARAAGATMFIVPQCSPDDPAPYLASCRADLVRAAKRAGSKIKIVPVLTFDQAISALRAAGGAPVIATSSTTSTTVVA